MKVKINMNMEIIMKINMYCIVLYKNIPYKPHIQTVKRKTYYVLCQLAEH